MELDKLLFGNYLPYAKSVIIERALPGIDGFKPVQRRVLVTMEDLGLLKPDADYKKSQKIVGQTMGIHPHGDSSIYEAMQLMTTDYGALNVPYVQSKGSFGKKYSRDLKCGAPRYTNGMLAPICNELFESIKDNAVRFIDNYDCTEKEPELLPVKFPTILVNGSSGVAVGTSTEIPSFSLTHVCKAVQGIIDGSIKTPADLADVLVSPEFPTGGFIHVSKKSMEKLCATGRGSFVLSGKVEIYASKIVINEIPYTTTAEAIIEAIEEAVKEKKIRGISEVDDYIGKDGFSMIIELKKGTDARAVLRDLCILTPLRSSISYRTKVIINDRCKEFGLLELLNTWIDWRAEVISNIYNFRLDRESQEQHLLEAWEKIGNNLTDVAQIMSSNIEQDAKNKIMSKYGLSELQADYIMDRRIRNISKDNAKKSLDRLAKVRELIREYKDILGNVNKQIYKEQAKIIEKYGEDSKTTRAEELTDEDTKRKEVEISSDLVTVVYTKAGFVRRLTSTNDMINKFVSKTGDEEVLRWNIRNNEHILVFDRYGTIHKVLVDNIDASNKAQMTDELYKIAGLEKAEDMIYADACGDYSGYFNLIYPNGRGRRVLYERAQGSRAKYKAYYEEVKPGRYWITKEDKFFMITSKLKAAYCDLTRLNQISNREAFKVARTASSDPFNRLMSYKELPNPSLIDLSKYNKGYTVLIGDDYFWEDKEASERAKQLIADHLNKYNKEEDNSEENEEVE